MTKTTQMEIERTALALLDQAPRKVQTFEHYEDAGAFLKRCKLLRTQVEEFMKPVIQAAHEAHKAALARQKQAVRPIEEAEQITKKAMVAFQAAIERERRAQEEAAQEMERQRAQEEARRVAELLRAKGDEEQALEVEACPEVFEEPINFEMERPAADGISIRQVWKYRITDEAALPREYLMPDERKIGQVVRAMKALTQIPGVVAYPESSVATRI